jgi:hypothetical protein
LARRSSAFGDGYCPLQVAIGVSLIEALARRTDRLVDLVEQGVITTRRKRVHPGRIVTSFVTGTPRLFDFVHDNPLVEFHPSDRTNDTALIRWR